MELFVDVVVIVIMLMTLYALGILIWMSATTIYEVELKDGSIEESFDCYEKDEKKICEIDLEKKVVVDYWKIEK